MFTLHINYICYSMADCLCGVMHAEGQWHTNRHHLKHSPHHQQLQHSFRLHPCEHNGPQSGATPVCQGLLSLPSPCAALSVSLQFVVGRMRSSLALLQLLVMCIHVVMSVRVSLSYPTHNAYHGTRWLSIHITLTAVCAQCFVCVLEWHVGVSGTLTRTVVLKTSSWTYVHIKSSSSLCTLLATVYTQWHTT